jgi:hypothetical protein
VLENPRPVLQAQLSRLREETFQKLKAEGAEYEERMEKLDALEWPKPNRDFIYATFNDFADRHPWVGSENIAPKSVAREMIERFCSFHDYIRDYGLQRVEGILLRYLSEAYRGVAQSIPRTHLTPEIDDVILTLASLVRGVDASLLEEWESLRAGTDGAPALVPVQDTAGSGRGMRGGSDLLSDPRALQARVRTDLHRLLGALARKDYEDALQALRPPSDEGHPPWTSDRLASALQPFFEDHAGIVTTPAARNPRNTIVTPDGEKRWQVQQRLIDPDGHDDWAIYATVDLSTGVPNDGPLIELDRLGV